MEDKNKNENAENCNCIMCRARGGHRHSFIRFILLLVIIAIVFSLGVKIGELKSEFGGSYGFHMNRGYMMYPMMYPGANYWYGQSSTTPR